jgi:hypothetical protein
MEIVGSHRSSEYSTSLRAEKTLSENRASVGYDVPFFGGGTIKTVDLKSDMPPVHEALQRLDRELALAQQQKLKLLKIIHGYGSKGVGGDIKIAVQARLQELVRDAQIRGCIYGENWSKSDDLTWKLLGSNPALKGDEHLGRRNPGITIVLL